MAFRPPDFEALLARTARSLRDAGIPFMIIGGQAMLLHGEPRLTQNIDITLAVTPEELDTVLDACARARLAIERAVMVRLQDVDVPFATAEDLLIHKLFAGRARDIEDAAGVVRRNRESIDWPYVEQWVRAFAEVPGREHMIDQVRKLMD